MKTLFKTLLLLLLITSFTTLNAQSDSIRSSAGIATTDFKSLKVKFLKMDDKYYVFLVDPQGTIYPNKNVTLTVKSDAEELFSPKVPVSPFQDNGFVLNKQPGNFRTLKLDFKLKDAQQTANLRASLSNKPQEQSGFLCPMHPTEVFQSEGVCPKCNMALVTKKISVYDVASEKEKSKP
ncbi:MAG: hypothetical protein JWN78_502 [Bacteroidota bacterium]|nr:hypothetical protein [Bacteroidota bacterium]